MRTTTGSCGSSSAWPTRAIRCPAPCAPRPTRRSTGARSTPSSPTLVADTAARDEDLALVRSGAPEVLLSFAAGDLSVELEIRATPEGRELAGQLLPPQPAAIDARAPRRRAARARRGRPRPLHRRRARARARAAAHPRGRGHGRAPGGDAVDDALTAPAGGRRAAAAALAEEAIRLAQADPHAARRDRAARAGPGAAARGRRGRLDGRAGARASRRSSWATWRRAASHLRRAVAVAEARRAPLRAAQARMSLALALTLLGATGEALRGDRRGARRAGGGRRGARADAARGHPAEARAARRGAGGLPRRGRRALRRHGDTLWEARLLANRAVLQRLPRRARAPPRPTCAAPRRSTGRSGRTSARRRTATTWAGSPRAAATCRPRSRPTTRPRRTTAGSACRSRCCSWTAARCCWRRGSSPRRGGRPSGRWPSWPRQAWRRTSPRRGSCSPTRTSSPATPRRRGSSRSQAQRAFTRQHRPAWAALARYAALRASRLAGRATPADAAPDRRGARGRRVGGRGARRAA